MKKYLCSLYLLPALLFALLLTKAIADDVIVGDVDPDALITPVTLRWLQNDEPGIAGYNVYYRLVSGDYARIKTVRTPTATINVKGSQRVYFAVTAYNTSGIESPFSEEVYFP